MLADVVVWLYVVVVDTYVAVGVPAAVTQVWVGGATRSVSMTTHVILCLLVL